MGYDWLDIPLTTRELNAAAFRPETTGPVISPTGHTGIFHFPFRIYAGERLLDHTGATGGSRYRVHEPFLVRHTGAAITDDVPRHLWPNFHFHAEVPMEMRGEQAPAPDLYYPTPARENVIWYDGFRLDIWAPDAGESISPFAASALRWLRLLSLQPWISDVDRFYGSPKKRSFPIDDNGAALHETPGLVRLRPANIFPVTNQEWRHAFEKAAISEVPVFYNLYFDAINAAAIDDFARAIMGLTTALEGARDYYFSQIHPAKIVSDRGPRLAAPFNNTKLLRHLSADSKKRFSRDLSLERPNDWPHMVNIYTARGHVAHGKKAVYSSGTRLEAVTWENFLPLQKAAWSALQWMEDVARTTPHTE